MIEADVIHLGCVDATLSTRRGAQGTPEYKTSRTASVICSDVNLRKCFLRLKILFNL
jgi:hypothetical protein